MLTENILRAVLTVLSLVLAAASAQARAEAAASTTALDEPLFASPTELDGVGRILAPVMINGQGPFRLMVDTGATHSTVSTEVAQFLGLEPSTEYTVLLNGVTGSAVVPTITVDRLEAGAFVKKDALMPVVPSAVMGGADGILGVAGMRDRYVMVDFRKDRVVIARSRSRSRLNLSRFLTVDARLIGGGLFAIEARILGVPAIAVVDTGAERTLGNNALRDALRARRRHMDDWELITVYGITPDVSVGEAGFAPPIKLAGSITITDVAITFGDFHIFNVWDLNERPAMLLGMDVLGAVDAAVFDFGRRQMHLLARDPDR